MTRVVVDTSIAKFLDNLATQNEKSAETVGYFLRDWEVFVTSQLKTTPSELVRKIKDGTATADPKEEQVYRILQTYAAWLKKNRLDTGDNNARTVKLKIGWARTLLESCFIPISRTLFKQLIKSPKPEEPETSPIDKKTVTTVITALDDLRLQSYALWCASMGWRATESLSLRNLNFEGLNLQTLKFDPHSPAYVNTSGKHAKTRKGKRRRLTSEMRGQIERLLAHRYRERTIARKVNNNGGNGSSGSSSSKWAKVTIKPVPKSEDRMFTPYHAEKNPVIKNGETLLENAYMQTSEMFRNTIDRIGIGFEEGGKRRKVTLHTLRRFCYTTCTRAVDEQYAKYHCGRKVHEYDKRTDDEIAEDFASVEPFLTFFNTTAVEQRQASLEKEQVKTRADIDRLNENNTRQQMENQLLTAVVLAESPQEKAEAARKLREFYRIQEQGRLHSTQNLEVVGAAGGGGVNFVSRPQIISKSDDGNEQIASLGAFAVVTDDDGNGSSTQTTTTTKRGKSEKKRN